MKYLYHHLDVKDCTTIKMSDLMGEIQANDSPEEVEVILLLNKV